MLQRVQTIYLLAGVIWTVSMVAIAPILDINQEPNGIQGNPILLAAYAVVVLLFIIAIASYKKRNFQVNVNRVNTVYNLLLFGGLAFVAYFQIPQSSSYKAHLDWGAVVPVLNIVLLYLANRGIIADEALVRSLDRLR